MYSKKINQLATNLNPQSTDLIAIGDAETGQLKTTTYNLLSGVSSDGVISGGIVTWTGTGLVFNISACVYYLNGVRYSSPFSTKTLAAADPTNPRIDVFAVNTSGQVVVIQGTPNANPVEPEGDTPTTLGLTNVTIAAGATTPSGVTRDLIYDENVESWTKTFTQSNSTVDYANTTFPNTGSKSILVTQGAGFMFLNFSNAVALDISNYKSLSFAIRLTSAWTSNTILSVRFANGSNNVSNLFQINTSNNVGFNRNLAGEYQIITIPFNNTNLKFTSNAFTTIRIATQNAAATYRLDTIQLNSGIGNPTGGSTTPSNSFGFVNGATGTASSTTATDTLNIVGTGLITTSATGKTLTIASNQIATGSILGRVTAGTGNIETLTGTQATTLLDVFTSSLKGLAPASGGGTTNFLRADGTWAAPAGGGGSMAIGGSITSATAGSVLFAGTSGVLQQDNANFFWNDSTNRLGIGTNSPASTLDIIGGGRFSNGLTLNAIAATSTRESLLRSSISDNATDTFGIGNGTSTDARFTGLIYYYSEGNYGNLSFRGLITTAADTGTAAIINFQTYISPISSDPINATISTGPTTRPLYAFNSGNNIFMQMFANGNVTIQSGGTYTNNGFKLDVQGTSNFNGQMTATAITMGSPSTTTYRFNARSSTSGTPIFLFEQLTNLTNNAFNQVGRFSNVAPTIEMIDGFGSYVSFYAKDITAVDNEWVRIGAIRSGADNSGSLVLHTSDAGTIAERARITPAGRLLVGGTTESISAIMRIDSTTSGFLPPRMTTTQKNAIATPVAGLIVYDTTDNKHYGYNGTTWNAFF